MDTAPANAPADTDPDRKVASTPEEQAQSLETLRNLISGAGLTDLAEPDDDDPVGDTIEWVRTGVVRVWIAGTRYRLRRPMFGELRKLDTGWDEAVEEIRDKSDEAVAAADRIRADAEKIDANKTMKDATRRAKIRELQREDTRVSREMNDHREDVTAGWWTTVFEALSVDGVPDEVPVWMTSAGLPQRALQHWRSVPLGRGGQQTGTQAQPRS